MVKWSSFPREKEIFKVTLWGSLVNFLLLAFKFVSGFLGHSSAMIADAVHSLSDFITDIVVIAFVKVSGKPQDECHDYGHGKYETLATAIVGLVLCAVGIGLLVNSVETIVAFFKGDILEKPGMIALLAALISILSKEVLFRYTIMKGKAIGSQAVIANAWHHRSDALSSIGTLAGIGGAMFLGEKWRVLDPIAAFVVSIFIMKVSIDLLKPCIDELLEKYGIRLKNKNGYDYVYAANMCKADFLGDSVPDEHHLAKYIRNVVDDVDGYDGIVFNRWFADTAKKGIIIDWYDVV